MGIELHQAIEELRDHGPAIDVNCEGGVERGVAARLQGPRTSSTQLTYSETRSTVRACCVI